MRRRRKQQQEGLPGRRHWLWKFADGCTQSCGGATGRGTPAAGTESGSGFRPLTWRCCFFEKGLRHVEEQSWSRRNSRVKEGESVNRGGQLQAGAWLLAAGCWLSVGLLWMLSRPQRRRR